MTTDEKKSRKIVCPYCGYRMPLIYTEKSNINGLFLRCKGRKCRSIFEVKVENGVQERG